MPGTITSLRTVASPSQRLKQQKEIKEQKESKQERLSDYL